MPRIRPYSASQDSLFRPGQATDFFETGIPSTMAGLCAELSRLAYCPDDRVREVTAEIGVSQCEFFHARGTHAFLISLPSRPATILTFRGTESDPQNLRTDVRFWKSPWKAGGAVQSGFSEALLEIWPALAPELVRSTGPLVYTGHSLGAALALLAATLHPPPEVLTFGSPNVGNIEFAQLLSGISIQRYVNCCDIVTQVPPEALGFIPVGTLHYIDAVGDLLENPKPELIRTDQKSARFSFVRDYALKSGNVRFRDLADHAPINYVTALTE